MIIYITLRNKLEKLLVFLIIISLLIRCSLPDSSAGNSTQTGNGIVVGRIYEPDGKTLANGVTIYLIPVDYLPYLFKNVDVSHNIYTTFTNNSGEYRIDGIAHGFYNLFAEKGEYLAYKDSIFVDGKVKEVLVPPETLKIGGNICGKVRLENGEDPRTVVLLFIGTSIWSTPSDSSGNFIVTNIPAGEYKVRILTSLDNYLPKDTIINIVSGKTDTNNIDIVLKSTGIPVVEDLKLEYDTLKQIVALRWNKPDKGKNVGGYNIYRRNIDSNGIFIRINTTFVSDTFYYDSTVTQDEMYEYKVAIVDEDGNEGRKSKGVNVRIWGIYTPILFFGGESMKNIHGISFGFDSLIFIADKENSKIKVFDTGGNFLYQFGQYGDSESQFNGLWDVTIDKNGYIYTTELNHPRIQKFDQNGNFVKSWRLLKWNESSMPFFPSIATYDTFIYVTEVYSPTIRWYSTNTGNLIEEITLPTYGGWDITVDERGVIFIPIEKRVYIVEPKDKRISSFNLVGNSADIDSRGIAINKEGNILVCQLYEKTIFGYSMTGDYLFKFGSTHKEEMKIYFFSSITIDNADNIYIADGDKGKVIKYIKTKIK